MTRARLFAAACTVLGTFALMLTLGLSLHTADVAGTPAWRAVWRYFGYFTVLTNVLVVFALMAWAAGVRRGPLRFLVRTETQTATAVAIVMVFFIYHLLLRNLWNPQGWQWLSDQLLHTAMPILFVLHWWFAVPKTTLRWTHAFPCLAYPAAYAVYLFARGALDGWYPYPFVDVTVLGYSRVAVHLLAIVIAFAVVALVLIALGRWQATRLAVLSPAS
jgi:hypothetical protein